MADRRARAELDDAAAAGGRGTAGTAGVEAAGGRYGMKTIGGISAVAAAAGEGGKSPYWWDEVEDFFGLLGGWGKRAGEAAGDTLADLAKTQYEHDQDIASKDPRYQYSSTGEERGRGLLESAVENTGTTADQIVEDLKITHEKGLAGSTFTKTERHRLEAAEQYKEAEIKRVAEQNAVDKQADLDRYYANFPEDVEGKRERYLKALKEIYKKVAILNVISALTNSPSQAGAFMQMAAEKFKTLEGFRGEERLQKIARGVFFDENGEFDAPASKQDAFNRAMRFGANHDEAMELSGHKTEYAPSKTETGVRIWSNEKLGRQIWLTKDEAPTGPGWLPKELDTATGKDGTEYERRKSEAMELFGAGNVQGAIGAVSAWLQAKDIFERWNPLDADKAALNIIKRWAAGENVTEEEIDAMMEAQPTNIREE